MLTLLPWADHCPFVKRVSFGPQMKPVPRAGRSGNTNTQKPPYPQILLDLKKKYKRGTTAGSTALSVTYTRTNMPK
jgi:hypothetical protein